MHKNTVRSTSQAHDVTLDDNDRLVRGDFQAAFCTLYKNLRCAVEAIERESVVGGDPQLEGHVLVDLPNHFPRIGNPKSGLPAGDGCAAKITLMVGACVEVLKTQCERDDLHERNRLTLALGLQGMSFRVATTNSYVLA